MQDTDKIADHNRCLWTATKVLVLAAPSVLLLISLTGCQSSNPRKEAIQAETNPAVRRGEEIFKLQCALCHYANSTEPLHGPGLRGVMKKKYLPSGLPANDDRVGDVIRLGRNLMPAIPDMDDIAMRDLLAYLHTL